MKIKFQPQERNAHRCKWKEGTRLQITNINFSRSHVTQALFNSKKIS